MNKKNILLTGAALAALSATAHAALPVNATSDTYSYVFIGSNNPTNDQIRVGEVEASGHFNFGVVEFDVTSLSTSGSKFLAMQAEEYSDGGQTPTISPNGSLSVNVGVMPVDYSTYPLSPFGPGGAGPRMTWFNTNVASLTPIGQLSFVNQQTAYLDVTSTVNSWITSPSSNHGFVLWNPSTPGEVRIHSLDSPTGLDPQLTAVPEPSTYGLMVALLALGVALWRRVRS